jgi:hypothetical protein
MHSHPSQLVEVFSTAKEAIGGHIKPRTWSEAGLDGVSEHLGVFWHKWAFMRAVAQVAECKFNTYQTCMYACVRSLVSFACASNEQVRR